MARIVSSAPNKVVAIKQFYGLNENKGGDTKLRNGEASICQNWRVTRDGNLQRRPGKALVNILEADEPVTGIWNGWVGGEEYILAACNGYIYKVYDGTSDTFPCTAINATNITTSNGVHFFGFDSKAYMLTGDGYYVWDGATFSTVDGYVPVVVIAIGPDTTAEAAGTTFEQVNKLTNKRRVWLSPDGTLNSFKIPESPADITYVKKLTDGTEVPSSSWAYSDGVLALTLDWTTNPIGPNTYEVGYSFGTSYRSQVESMRFSEIYSGTTDSRVFLYGDGSNKTIYSDIDYDGKPSAEYFPDLNEAAVGDANTKITGLIRHHASLICFKRDSAWNITSSSMTLEDGTLISSFHVIPVNRILGNEAMGQVHLVLNNPRTLFQNELYEWRSNNAYSGNLSYDERQAKRISDRVFNTLRTFDLEDCVCFDDNPNQEYYVVYNGTAIVNNYAVDAWYIYDNINATCFATLHNELFFGGKDGRIYRMTEEALSDYSPTAQQNREVIHALWKSGSMDLGADYMRKYSSALWVSVKPESNSYVDITIETDRRNEFLSRTVARGVTGFAEWDFRSFTFNFNVMPQIKKLKIKAKKFVYYRIVFEDNEPQTRCTVLGADIRVRQTGYAK
ncbi:MAG: hypothetical protein J6Y83_04875 [Bacteroidales bacterium]|nr:hypothetical protein [Bacteroidales bacterium]